MLIVTIIFFFLLFSYLKTKPSDQSTTFVKIASVVLILLSSLRHEAVGNDTLAYMNHFESFSLSWQQIWQGFIPKYFFPGEVGKDPGIDVFDKLCKYLFDDGRWYLFVTSTITIFSIGFFIKDNAKNLQATFFSYIFYVTLIYQYAPNSAIRQSLALSILLFSFYYLKRKKLLAYFLLLLIASTFHKSALVGILLFLASYFKNLSALYKLSILGFILVLIFPNQVALLLGGSNDIYAGYIGGTYYTRASKPYMIIILMVGLFYISYLIKRVDQNIENNSRYYHGVLFSFIFTPLIWADPSALRLIAYFGFFIPLLIGNEIGYLHHHKLLFTLIVATFFVKNLITPSNYHFMWQEMQLHERYGYVLPQKNSEDAQQSTYFLA